MKEIRFSFDEDEEKKGNGSAHDIDGDEYIKNASYDYDEYEERELEISFEFDKKPAADGYTGSEDDEEYDDDDAEYSESDDHEWAEQPKEKRKTASKKRKAGKNKGSMAKRALMTVAAAAAVIAILLASPVFAVNTIEINEMSYFTSDEICSIIGLNTGDNGIFFNKRKAEKILESNKYISSADISFKMPDTMLIAVNENKIYGYIPYLGSYLYLDKEGRVIDIKTETDEDLPIIEGLKFEAFTQGEIIPVENKDAFEAALIISRAMSKYEMLDKNVKINVADDENIYAYIDNIKVLLGDTSRMEEKIKTMSEAVGEITEGDRGTLDLRDLDKTIIFKYST